MVNDIKINTQNSTKAKASSKEKGVISRRGLKVSFLEFVKDYCREFSDNSSSLISNGMVYSTLLAMVPCLAVIYAFLNLFGVLDPVVAALQEFIVGAFGAQTGDVLMEYLEMFTENAMGLGIISMLSFSVTFVMLIDKIFTVVNKIYHVKKPGTPVIRYLKYIGIIAIGLIGIVILVLVVGIFNSITMKILEITRFTALDWLIKTGVPIAVAFGILCATIYLIPSCKVDFVSGMIGAVVGTVGIVILCFIFSFVVRFSVKYSVIYGSLATVLFSIMFLSYFWKILLGAITLSYVYQRDSVGFKAKKCL